MFTSFKSGISVSNSSNTLGQGEAWGEGSCRTAKSVKVILRSESRLIHKKWMSGRSIRQFRSSRFLSRGSLKARDVLIGALRWAGQPYFCEVESEIGRVFDASKPLESPQLPRYGSEMYISSIPADSRSTFLHADFDLFERHFQTLYILAIQRSVSETHASCVLQLQCSGSISCRRLVD